MFKLTLLLVLATSCAFAYPDRSERIVGGENAGQGKIPSQASLRNWDPPSAHFAGGFLINNRWVVTAARPMVGRAQNSINVALGISLLAGSFISRRSSIIQIHPFYDPVTRVNNVACVQIPTVTFTQFIQPIFMVSHFISDRMIALVSGWGSTNPNLGPNADVLQWLDVVTINCTSNSLHFDIICAQGVFRTGGFCTTDIGGSLSTAAGSIGIASWHPIPCASQPDEYTRMSAVRSWIASVTGV